MLRITAAMIMLSVAGAASAGELNGATVPADLSYTITGCTAPEQPDSPDKIRTVEDYNAVVATHDAYVEALIDHLACVQAEAQTDLDKVSAAINEDAAQHVETAQASIDEAKAALDERREDFLKESGIR